MTEQRHEAELFDFKALEPDWVERPSAVVHLPLVAEIASEYLDRGLPLEDLVRAGTAGLELALSLAACPSDADPDHYIGYWIRRGIIGALVANQAVNDFTADFEQQSGRQPNLAEIRGFGTSESNRLAREMGAYVKVANDFVDSFYEDFGQLPSLSEAEAFGLARREQLKHKLAAYVVEFLVVDPTEVPDGAEAMSGPLYVPDSWLAGLKEVARQALILRYGLDGSGVMETRDVGYQLKLKTRKVGEILNQALTRLAEDNGIASHNLLVYPNLFDGMDNTDRQVLAMRLGSLPYAAMEVREIAALLSLSCETVRTTEWRAICYTKENADYNLVPEAVRGRSAEGSAGDDPIA